MHIIVKDIKVIIFMKNLHILQQESIDEGRLQVRVRQKNMGTPVADARVSVSYSGDPQEDRGN